MGVDCYCNFKTEQGNIPVPPLDKEVEPSNNIKNFDELNRQETYNRVITVNKNDKTSQHNKKDSESKSNNNYIINLENKENNNKKIFNKNNKNKII